MDTTIAGFNIKEGGIVFIAGFSGSGKTRLLELLHQEAKERWNGNVVYIPSPTRTRDDRPRCVLRNTVEEDIRFVFPEPEGKNSGAELQGILFSLVENGSIGRGTLLIIDEVEAGMHPKGHREMVERLETLCRELGLSLVITSHSIYFLRALEEGEGDVSYYRMKDGVAECVTGRTELIYRDFCAALEEL